MTALFPDDFEKSMLSRKRKISKKLGIEKEWTALDIALHTHEIYEYLIGLGVKNPNGVVVELFQYASTTLGVPYELIDDSYWTQQNLTIESLFDYSQTYNPNAKKMADSDLPVIPITIDFYETFVGVLEELSFDFWQNFTIKELNDPDNYMECFDLEPLFQSFLQEVWLKAKGEFSSNDTAKIEQAKQMFLAYFYSNDQKKYRPETMELMLESMEECVKKHHLNKFKANVEIEQFIKLGYTQEIIHYIDSHVADWLLEKNYLRFLRSISKTKNLTLMNQLLLLYQLEEAVEVKEIHDWIVENRTIKNDTKPIFLFGDTQSIIHKDTSEIIEDKRITLSNHEELPLVPFIEKEQTEGRLIDRKVTTTPEQLFIMIEQVVTKNIVFDSKEAAYQDTYSIHLKSGIDEVVTIQQLICEWVSSDKKATDSVARFENDSIVSVITLNLGFSPLPVDFSEIDYLRSLENGKIKIQKLLINVVSRSEKYLELIEKKMYEKQPEIIRRSLQEEIEIAKEKQNLAIATVQTEKENKKEESSNDAPSLVDLLAKVKTNTEESDDES